MNPSQTSEQTCVRSFHDGLVEERRDGADVPQLRHLSAWTKHNVAFRQTPSSAASSSASSLMPEMLNSFYREDCAQPTDPTWAKQ